MLPQNAPGFDPTDKKHHLFRAKRLRAVRRLARILKAGRLPQPTPQRLLCQSLKAEAVRTAPPLDILEALLMIMRRLGLGAVEKAQILSSLRLTPAEMKDPAALERMVDAALIQLRHVPAGAAVRRISATS